MSVNGNDNDRAEDDNSTIVKVRGLPWSTTADEIIDFFRGCNIRNGREGVQIVMTKEGRPSGEAFVDLESETDLEEALKRDREYVGTRYIEVFRCKRTEMEWIVRRSGAGMDSSLDDGCVRLRGLPFECSKEEIAQFFTGLEIVPNGITLPLDPRGRSTGEAYVQFRTKEIAEKALLKHKEKIGHRYIEIFRSSMQEVYPEGRGGRGGMGGMGGMGGGYPPRPAPYDTRDRFGGPNRFRGGPGMGPPSLMSTNVGGPGMGGRGFRGGYSDDMDDDDWSWRWGPRGGGPGGMGGGMGGMGGGMGGGMRGSNGGGGYSNDMGMNYNGGGGGGGYGGGFGGPSVPHLIYMRGLPFRATKKDIADFFRPITPLSIDLNPNDKGRAEVEFHSREDVVKAMSKDKSYMSHRYIELFMDKPPSGGNGPRGGSGGGGGGGGMDSMPTRFKR